MSTTLHSPPTHRRPAAAAAPSPLVVAELERVLVELRDTHERMLSIVKDHRAAISRADLPGISAAVAAQNQLTQTVAEIERRRANVVATILSASPTSPGVTQARLSQVIAAVPPDMRSRLSGLTTVLRDVLTRLHAEQQSLRIASETLALHMEGIMRQVFRTSSHAGTYIRSGRVDTGVQVLSAIDVRS